MISWISIIAIAVTTGALIVILSATNGLTTAVANLYNTFEPDLKIIPLKGKYFDADKAFIENIKSMPGVKLVSGTLNDKALLKNGSKQALVSVKGVDDNFNKITTIDSAIAQGHYNIDATRNNIVLGAGIANQLQINLSDYINELSLFSPVRGKAESLNPLDNMTELHCNPTGIFSLNNEFDLLYVFVDLETARQLFDSPNKLSALEILCDGGETAKVQEALQEKIGKDFKILNRYQLNDTLFKSLETEKLATFIILAFILIIATFNIIGALTMLIIEKKKDIQILYSLGADLNLVRGIFMIEGLLITGVGSVLGLLTGLFVCWLQIHSPFIKFGSDVIPYYPIELRVEDFMRLFALIMLIGFFATLYPVRFFTKVDLVK